MLQKCFAALMSLADPPSEQSERLKHKVPYGPELAVCSPYYDRVEMLSGLLMSNE